MDRQMIVELESLRPDLTSVMSYVEAKDCKRKLFSVD